MASAAIREGVEPRAGALLAECVAAHGSRSHRWATEAAQAHAPDAARNLADAIHVLCALHGRHPGLIEMVALRTLEPEPRAWLADAADAFGRERAWLGRLAVAAGPVPATPGGGAGAAASAAASETQRQALMTLAGSERRGCALGAAFALALDWASVRAVLDAAAIRFDVAPAAPYAIRDGDVIAAFETAAKSVAIRRAAMFGAEQVALQHRAMWDLLWARAQARLAA